ncbi:MAG: hypothetical protein K8L97_33865 [Anaerolineae bacterium]|nr:hypothetical protein [Anaerolineae bacterium]
MRYNPRGIICEKEQGHERDEYHGGAEPHQCGCGRCHQRGWLRADQHDSGIGRGEREFFHAAREQYAASPTIQAVLDLSASEAYVQEGEKVDLGHFDHQAALERSGHLDELLAGVADAGQVKQFLYDLAVHVAEAAGPGVFGRGKPISPQEGMYLKLLKEKLGLYQ